MSCRAIFCFNLSMNSDSPSAMTLQRLIEPRDFVIFIAANPLWQRIGDYAFDYRPMAIMSTGQTVASFTMLRPLHRGDS